MMTELQELAEKVDSAVAAIGQLRTENTRLRNQVAQLSAERQALQERLAAAAAKIEGILEQLPQEQNTRQ